MANLQSADSCLQPTWSNSQAKNNSHSGAASKKPNVARGGGNSKRPAKRLPKKTQKSSSVDSSDMFDDDQDHLEACFKDSDYGMFFGHGNGTVDSSIVLKKPFGEQIAVLLYLDHG